MRRGNGMDQNKKRPTMVSMIRNQKKKESSHANRKGVSPCHGGMIDIWRAAGAP